jgi:hypothetical protein
VPHVRRVSSRDKRTSCVPCLKLLLTVWAGLVTINILPDDVLLHVFHFVRVTYLDQPDQLWCPSWRWHLLVHVCRRWRSVVFSSPNFLDLKLVCTPWTRAELTGIWPPLPIIIKDIYGRPMPDDYDFNAVILHRNRVCQIDLCLSSSQMQRFGSAMQERFPELRHLKLYYVFDKPLGPAPAPALPDGFLGGSAPRLRSLELHYITFPALPKLFLSATHLVHLALRYVPDSGCILPEAIVLGLAVLANLKSLHIKFDTLQFSHTYDSRSPPPPTRTVLPALTDFVFLGFSNYLEDLVARIDAPLLGDIHIIMVDLLPFDLPQLARFMRRTTSFEVLNEAHVVLNDDEVLVKSLPPTQTFDEKFELMISCPCAGRLDWQLLCLAEVFTSFFSSIYRVERLNICVSQHSPSQWQDDIDKIENMQLLEIFRPFTAVKNLYISKKFALCTASALHELVEEGVPDLLPALESISLEGLQKSGPVQEAIGQFVAARQLLGHHVAVSDWNWTGGSRRTHLHIF